MWNWDLWCSLRTAQSQLQADIERKALELSLIDLDEDAPRLISEIRALIENLPKELQPTDCGDKCIRLFAEQLASRLAQSSL